MPGPPGRYCFSHLESCLPLPPPLYSPLKPPFPLSHPLLTPTLHIGAKHSTVCALTSRRKSACIRAPPLKIILISNYWVLIGCPRQQINFVNPATLIVNGSAVFRFPCRLRELMGKSCWQLTMSFWNWNGLR